MRFRRIGSNALQPISWRKSAHHVPRLLGFKLYLISRRCEGRICTMATTTVQVQTGSSSSFRSKTSGSWCSLATRDWRSQTLTSGWQITHPVSWTKASHYIPVNWRANEGPVIWESSHSVAMLSTLYSIDWLRFFISQAIIGKIIQNVAPKLPQAKCSTSPIIQRSLDILDRDVCTTNSAVISTGFAGPNTILT